MNQKRASLGRKYPSDFRCRRGCTCSLLLFFPRERVSLLQTPGSSRDQGDAERGHLTTDWGGSVQREVLEVPLVLHSKGTQESATMVQTRGDGVSQPEGERTMGRGSREGITLGARDWQCPSCCFHRCHPGLDQLRKPRATRRGCRMVDVLPQGQIKKHLKPNRRPSPPVPMCVCVPRHGVLAPPGPEAGLELDAPLAQRASQPPDEPTRVR
jgi:hypothetical protein